MIRTEQKFQNFRNITRIFFRSLCLIISMQYSSLKLGEGKGQQKNQRKKLIFATIL